jgi:hypothetical protein
VTDTPCPVDEKNSGIDPTELNVESVPVGRAAVMT